MSKPSTPLPPAEPAPDSESYCHKTDLRPVPSWRETVPSPPPISAVQLGVATVLAVDGAFATVMYEGRRLSAERAVSCLVAPAAGDLTLISVVPDNTAFVLAVLRRDAGAGVQLVADGEITVTPEQGRFVVDAPQGVDLQSTTEVRVQSGRFAVRALDGELSLERLTLVAQLVQSRIDQVKVLARAIDTLADRVLSRVKRSYRFVTEHEQVRARSADVRAEQSLSLRGKHTVLTAREVVKLDGKQIHVG